MGNRIQEKIDCEIIEILWGENVIYSRKWSKWKKYIKRKLES